MGGLRDQASIGNKILAPQRNHFNDYSAKTSIT
jgi:hypothetical protein